jgi:hypothetical protein
MLDDKGCAMYKVLLREAAMRVCKIPVEHWSPECLTKTGFSNSLMGGWQAANGSVSWSRGVHASQCVLNTKP